MVMATFEFVGTLKFQFAARLSRLVVLPSTTAVLPTKPSACVDCAVCCSDTSEFSWSLVLSCCSTPANCTSCWVNWLVSSGSSGFWFCSCVVSSVRKVWKLPASVASAVVPNVAPEASVLVAGSGVVPDTTGGATDAVVMSLSSHADVDAAARSGQSAIASSCKRCGNAVVVADDQPVRMAEGFLSATLAGGTLIAQAELQAVITGLEAGLIECALQLVRVLAQHRQRFRLLHREMRGDLAVAVEIDADVDAAKLRGVEPDFE